MSFPDPIPNRPFTLGRIHDSTIVSRRLHAGPDEDEADGDFTEQQDILIPEHITDNEMLLTKLFGYTGDENSMNLAELSSVLAMQDAAQAMDTELSLQRARGYLPTIDQTDSSAHLLNPQVPTPETGTTITHTNTTPSIDTSSDRTTVRLTVSGKSSAIYLASDATVQKLRQMINQAQAGPGRLTVAARACIAGEVLKGDVRPRDLRKVQHDLQVDDTERVASLMSDQAAWR